MFKGAGEDNLKTIIHSFFICNFFQILEKDANINVCALAARCITSLANGLRKKFAMHVNLVIPVIFEKFKEKKPVLRDPLIDCIDAVAATVSIIIICFLLFAVIFWTVRTFFRLLWKQSPKIFKRH